MAIPVQSQIYNPISGVFGTGQVQFFGPQSGSFIWTVPQGIGKVRARCWGGGATSYAGGFAMKAIYDLTGVTIVPITVSSIAGGTSSFGSYVSATGAVASTSAGYGVGGDINTSGNGTQVGNLFGAGYSLFGAAGATGYASEFPGQFSIDFIGCGSTANGYTATFPGGGGGTSGAAYGLVIVEW